MTIRQADNSDCERIKRLVFTVLKEYGLKSDVKSTDKDLNDIEGYYQNNGGFFGVVEENEKLIATVGIFRISPEICELRKMYSSPNKRGKGLGNQLMDFSLSKAKELRFKKMILETASPLVEAISLYKKYGFTEYEPEHLSPRCDQGFERIL